MTDFFDDLERELRRAHRRDTASRARSRLFDRRRLPSVPARRLLSVPLAAAAAVGVVVVVLAVLGAIDNNDADRRPQPVGTVPTPSMEAVAAATQTSEAVIRKRVSRGLASLRRKLEVRTP